MTMNHDGQGDGSRGRRASPSLFFFYASRRRHTRFDCDWSSDVCSSDLWVLEDGKEMVGKLLDHLLAAAELGGLVEVREIRELVGVCQRGDDLLVNLVAEDRKSVV